MWVESFFDTSDKDEREKSVELFTHINIATAVTNIVSFYIVGFIGDKIPTKIMMPFIFLFTGLICFLFMLVKTPDSFFSYATWCLLALGFMI